MISISSAATPAVASTTFDVVVIGGGLAGVATAAALARARDLRVLLVEQEKGLGKHASGRSAGMVRQAVEDPALAPWVREGAAFIANSDAPFRPNGSWLLGASQRIPAAVLDNLEHRWLDGTEACARVPEIGPLHEPVLEVRGDGIVDVAALVAVLLAEFLECGGQVMTGAPADRPEIAAGRVAGVRVAGQAYRCRELVIAAGAWSADWGVWGGVPVRLEPRRRHIVRTSFPERVRQGEGAGADWPWIWDLETELYLRPAAEGLIWSPCDETADAPGEPEADSAAPAWLEGKISARFPRLQRLEVRDVWAGHRTFAPDGRFLLGPDPRLPGWHWATGLGGHGVTAAAAVGRRVAAAIRQDESLPPEQRVRPAVLEGEDSSLPRADLEGVSG